MLRNITRIIFILLGMLAFGTGPVGAATIAVTANAPDVLNGADGSCALREAITNINNAAMTFADCVPVGAYGTADTINLPTGTYANAIPGNDNLNAKGDLDIIKSVSINGPAFTPPALPTAIIDGGGAAIGRVFNLVSNGITVSINNVIIQNGKSIGGGAGSGIDMGGSGDALTVTNSIIQNNGPGGIHCWTGNSTLTVTNSSIISNTGGEGGGIFASQGCTALTITNSHIDSNTAGVNGGGGIADRGTPTIPITINITGSTISNNTTTGNGGGIQHSFGTMTITSSTINGNSSAITGGGIRNSTGVVAIHSSTISNNTTAPLGTFGGGIECNFNAVSLTIDDSMGTGSTISGNTANLGGGGIAVFKGATTISDTTISSNTTTTGDGGGIRIETGNGTLTITNAAISGNTATAGRGGGIFNSVSSATVSNSTISGNTAQTSGGGIAHVFSIAPRALTLVNSTLSGNTVTAGSGGGIATSDILNSTNSTITKNSATTTGGGIQIGGAAVNLKNTIVANQAAGGDCSAAVSTTLNDLDSDGSCGVGTTAANALLGPLAANGGPIPTQTHTLLTGSPALDVGDAGTCVNAPVNNKDQRGLLRPQGTVCDIGAVEANHQPQPTAPNIINTGLLASSQVTHHDPDTANPGNTWTYSVQTAPANGGATVDLGGFATYRPNPAWLGSDSFVVKVQDDGILPLFGTVTVIVNGNMPPVPSAPAINTTVGVAGASQVAPNDPDAGDTHTYAVTTAAVNGAASINAAGLASYTSNAGFAGNDSFTVTVTDNGVPQRSGTVVINVVVTDITAPVITLLGATPVSIVRGSIYNDAGATAADNVDGNITVNIATVNPVTPGIVGVYTVTYNVSDAAGNAAAQVTRTVNVTAPAPILYGGGGCTIASSSNASVDSSLPVLALLSVFWLAIKRKRGGSA